MDGASHGLWRLRQPAYMDFHRPVFPCDPTLLEPVPMRAVASMLLLLALSALVGLLALSRAPGPLAPLPPRNGPALAAATAWGYQLQYVDPLAVPGEIDMIVVDYSRDGTAARAFKSTDVEALRRRPDGKPRIVLCYLSIGEAENYRAYWDMSWNSKPPQWLGAENGALKFSGDLMPNIAADPIAMSDRAEKSAYSWIGKA